MYKKEKAEKLIKEFNYLIGEKYYPFGKKGRVFKIEDITTELSINKTQHTMRDENSDSNHRSGENWKVLLIISESNDKMKVELTECLGVLKIRHDIDKLFND